MRQDVKDEAGFSKELVDGGLKDMLWQGVMKVKWDEGTEM